MTETLIRDPRFLGVEQSFSGKPWRARLDETGDRHAQALAQRFGLPDPLARILAGRKVGLGEVETHLAPTLRALMPDPSTLRGLDEAVERLAGAIAAREKVGIFGDYDVDGAASSALLADYLDRCAVAREIHIPDRILEGYGPNPDAIDALARRGVGLLVCVDCGTASHDALAYARRLGLDAIVIDHHLAPAELPDAIVVNPNRQDCLSGLGHLCAAGVVLMVLVGLSRRLRECGFWSDGRPQPDLFAALDIVALATVADVAPLTGLNRAFVARGMEAIRRRTRPGLAGLMDVARLNGPPEPWHLGFLLGPRINAGGRIGDAALGARLLLEQDPMEIARIAAELDRLNEERRAIEAATVEQAIADAGTGEAPLLVASGEGWHPGVVGLVASRLKERFGRPAFAISWSGEIGVGSARSIPGIDLGRAVRAAVEAGILVKGGGHAMAAGVTVTRDRFEAFQSFLHARLAAQVDAVMRDDALPIDGAVSAGGATLDLVAAVSRAGPFGAGNPEPVFALAAHKLVHVSPVGTDHLRLCLEARDGARLEAIAFRSRETPLGRALQARCGDPLHAAVSLSLDRWGGREKVSARLVDAAPVHA